MREYLLVLLIAAATTYLLSGLARKVAVRFGAVALVRDRDVHTVPIPYFGGLAMLGGLVAAFIAAEALPWLGRNEIVAHDTRAVLLGAAVICVVGILDDIFDLPAVAKASGQVLAAGVVVVNGVRVYWIPLPDSIISLDDGSAIFLTVVVVFACVNAINLVDGLDGLAAGVVAIGAGAFFLYAYLLSYEQDLVRATPASLISVATLGICIGFVPHNFHKAKMFMGDSGSMLLGLLMATMTVTLTGQIDPSQLHADGGNLLPAYTPLILPFAALALPLVDMIMAYTRRMLAGKPWYKPDKQHIHHRLLRGGHSHRSAVLLMWLWSAVLAYGVIVLVLWPGWVSGAVVAVALVLALWLTFRPRRGVLDDR
ncbi:glycosyltransferase family 4 protein [Propionicicella superfundia]|uniref:glycosyltransferase family 4 protein n=1 Tax=Propionicicella superfundia TaxID=348582 RepID=UPI000422AB1F|nr:MraY family glycosyltransferase [Propionicicella superfundia]